MSCSTDVQILCDGPNDVRFECTEPEGPWGSNAAEARNVAKDWGWQVNAPGGKDYCPVHRKTKPRGGTR